MRGFLLSMDSWRIRKSQYSVVKGQAFGPVRWVEVVQAIRARGVSHVIECGPGKVLAGLAKRIDKTLDARAIGTPADFDAALSQFA